MTLAMAPVLAFGFASPWLLWGLLAAGAPVLIHLLNRRKYRETSWAAMQFLLEAVRKNSRRIRIEQLILLAVRTLILVCASLALARPFVEQMGTYFQVSQPTHKIIVIDASFSMGYRAADAVLFDRACTTAREIVEASPQGDAFNLVRLSNLSPAVIVENPAFQPDEVVAEIGQLQLPHGRSDVLTSLHQVEDLLKLAPDISRKEVYLISDFQRSAWTGDSGEQAADIHAVLKRLGAAASLKLLDVGQQGADNLAVTDFSALDPFATITRAVRFKTVVRNFSSQRVPNQMLELLIDGKLTEQRPVDIAAGAEVTENFSHKFEFGGEHRVQVRLQKDDLPIDNTRWLSVPVKEQVRVLCVSGKNSGGTLGKATDYLELALAPVSSGTAPRALIEPQVINEGELQAMDLARFDCIILCNVRMFTEREAEILQTYLQGGGGVIWCLGDQVQGDNYNQVLYRGGKGILPARLENRQGNPTDRTTAFTFVPEDFQHPIINAFQGNPDAGLETTRTVAYIRAVTEPKSAANVALRFDSGDPAIVEMNVGAGKSVLVTTSVDDQWGNWPLWPSFVPMMHEMVLYAVSGRSGQRQHIVGETLSEMIPTGGVVVEVSLTKPDGQAQPVRVTAGKNFSQFSYDQTPTSGIYEINISAPLARTELFAVNVDPRECDLTRLSREELTGGPFAGIDFEYNTQLERTSPESEAPATGRGGLTRWLLYATLYLVFVELLMAWQFRYGLWLLCPPLLPAWWFWSRRRS